MQGGFRTNECMFDCEFLSFAICNYGFSNLILRPCVVEFNVIEIFFPYILQEHFHHFFLKDLFNVA